MPPHAIARSWLTDLVSSPVVINIRHAAVTLINNGSRFVAKSITNCVAIVALPIPITIVVATGGDCEVRVTAQRHSASTKSAPRSWRQSARCLADSLITDRCVGRKRTRHTSPDPMRYAIPKYLRVKEKMGVKFHLEHLHEPHDCRPNDHDHQERKDAEHGWENHFH